MAKHRYKQKNLDWLLVKVLHPTRHKIGHFGDVPQLGMEKLNLTQQKQTFTNQNECTQNKHKKTKPRFSRLLRHLAWKRERVYSYFGAS